jgi:hypothetical protein
MKNLSNIRIDELKNRIFGNSQRKRKEKKIIKNKESLWELWDSAKRTNIRKLRVCIIIRPIL